MGAIVLILLVFITQQLCCYSLCSHYTTVRVSPNGKDTPGCRNCSSIMYAVNKTQDCVQIIVMYHQFINSEMSLIGKTGVSIVGQSSGLVNMTCNGTGGLLIHNSIGIELKNLIWNHCGYESDKLTGAVQVIGGANITVNNCTFTSNANNGLVLVSVGSSINITSSVFTRNEAVHKNTSVVGLYIYSNTTSSSSINTVYDISSCLFEHNSNAMQASAKGGGLYIKVDSNLSIKISNCVFTANRAMIGGGVYIDLPVTGNTGSVYNTATLSNCSFFSNAADILGGGMYFGVTSVLQFPQTLDFKFSLRNCTFDGNSAAHAGGLAYQVIGQQSQHLIASAAILSSIFHNNTASVSGAAIGGFKWEEGLGGEDPVVVLRDCSITHNIAYRYSKEPSFSIGNGIIYSQGIPLAFNGTSSISNNVGTGILASSCSIYMNNKVVMENNNAVRGGAIQLISGSRVVVGEHLDLVFKKNYAELFGGAIYHVFPVLGVVGQNKFCIFQYYNDSITDPQLWNAHISFENNTALESGLSIYLSSPDSCHMNKDGFIFTEQAYQFVPNYTLQVSTPPVTVIFSNIEGSNQINCSEGYCSASVMLGEKLKLNATAIDMFGQYVHGFAVVSINCIEMINRTCNYSIGGSNIVGIMGSGIQVPFYIKGNYNHTSSSDVMLIWQLIEQPTTVAFLHIHIRKCYLGYVYNPEQRICTCYSKTDNVVCNLEFNRLNNGNSYTACIQQGYWYGQVLTDDTGNPQYAALPCPLGNCNYSGQAGCPTRQCGPKGSPYYFYCVLPQDESDDLCLFNKGGTQCAYCKRNYSFTMSNIECIPSDQCHSGYIALYVFLNLLFWMTSLSMILMAAKFDLRIGSGQLYCLIFYFSILQYFVGDTFLSKFLYAVQLLFTGFIQVNPEMFGLIAVCSGINTSNLTVMAVHYANPLLLATVIVLIVYTSSRWPRFAMLAVGSKSSGINAICILLYILFISLTQSSLSTLLPLKYPGLMGVYVMLVPDHQYFDSTHLPYALVALTIQIFLIFPFLFLLTLSPYLIRFRSLNLTRIKPILDEFQACYHDKYRSFAGYYLLCRQIIFVVFLLNLGIFSFIYILQVFSIFMLVLHCVVQPYRSIRLNILDSLLLLDLILLSLLHGNTANIVFEDILIAKTILIYILILLPILYLLCICAIHLIAFVVPKIKKIKFGSPKPKTQAPVPVSVSVVGVDSNNASINGIIDEQFDGMQHTKKLEREPLLFMQSDSTSLLGSSSPGSPPVVELSQLSTDNANLRNYDSVTS